MTSALARLDALDLRLHRRAARWQTPALDRLLPRLTSSAWRERLDDGCMDVRLIDASG